MRLGKKVAFDQTNVAQRREDRPFPVVPRVNCVAQRKTKAKGRDADRVLMIVNTEEIVFQQSTQIVHARFVPGIRILPPLYQPLERLHQENPRTAAWVKD